MLEYIHVQVADIKEFGRDEATFLHYLHYKIKEKHACTLEHDGRRWVKWTAKAWSEYFGIFSEQQVTRIIRKLEKVGAIIKGCFDPNPSDRTMWIAPLRDLVSQKPTYRKRYISDPIDETENQDRQMSNDAPQTTRDEGDTLDTTHLSKPIATSVGIDKCTIRSNKEDLIKNTFLGAKEKRSKGTAKVVSPEDKLVLDIVANFGVGTISRGQQGQWREPDLVEGTKSLVRRLTNGDIETLELFWRYLYENNRAVPLGAAYPWKNEFDTFLSERERYKAAS